MGRFVFKKIKFLSFPPILGSPTQTKKSLEKKNQKVFFRGNGPPPPPPLPKISIKIFLVLFEKKNVLGPGRLGFGGIFKTPLKKKNPPRSQRTPLSPKPLKLFLTCPPSPPPVFFFYPAPSLKFKL